MDYEKAYKDALERAKNLHKDAIDMGENIRAKQCEIIFPELKESGDERIRNRLIAMCQHYIECYSLDPYNTDGYKEALAWLEKQAKLVEEYEDRLDRCACESFNKGYKAAIEHQKEKQGEQEQDPCEHCKDKCLNCHNFPCIEKRAFEQGKSVFDVINEEKVDNANKVEPKFKVGDWITNGDYTWKIVEVKPLDYILQSQDGNIVDDTISHVDEQFHSFTIQDAKEGDMLYFSDNTIVIFKDLYNATTFHSYCHIEDGVFDISKDDMPDWWEGKGFHPATKEQRDLLFSKMKEAGYEWDEEKKELRKIEKKPIQETKSFEIEHGKYYYCIKDCFCGGRKQASKGDVVQALRGLPIMSLKDASEYFLPVNFIKEIW